MTHMFDREHSAFSVFTSSSNRLGGGKFIKSFLRAVIFIKNLFLYSTIIQFLLTGWVVAAGVAEEAPSFSEARAAYCPTVICRRVADPCSGPGLEAAPCLAAASGALTAAPWPSC